MNSIYECVSQIRYADNRHATVHIHSIYYTYFRFDPQHPLEKHLLPEKLVIKNKNKNTI